MSARCPEGHLSDSLDYCDVCGSPMGAGGAAPAGDGGAGGMVPSSGYGVPPASGLDLPGPGGTTQAATQTCPHCGALNVVDALFCEACGYDFTTGTPPMDAEPAGDDASDAAEDQPLEASDAAEDQPLEASDAAASDLDAEQPLDTGADEQDGGAVLTDAPAGTASTDEGSDEGDDDAAGIEGEGDVEDEDEVEVEDENAPSAPLASLSAPSGATEAGHSAPLAADESEREAAEPESAEPESAEPGPETPAAVPAHRKARHTPPSRALAEAWVVELWVDPDWYAVQQTEEACPSAGVPDTVLLTRSTALIGRPSGSLGARPEIDAGADSAVSRRHAQLTSDGQRWWVEDLGSSNGTFVGTVGEPLPTKPLTPGQRVEIDRDDRLYVGAWTRIVLRQATESERQGTG